MIQPDKHNIHFNKRFASDDTQWSFRCGVSLPHFSLAVVLELCVFSYLQHFPFAFLLPVCMFLLLLSFCDSSIFLGMYSTFHNKADLTFLLHLFYVFLHHFCIAAFGVNLLFCSAFPLVGHHIKYKHIKCINI